MRPVGVVRAVRSFDDVDALARAGVNLCRGCEYERAAACEEGRIGVCASRYGRLRAVADTLDGIISKNDKQ